MSISASSSHTVIGVNDKILEYKEGYEPINFGGQVYLPYTVFLNGLDVLSVYNEADKVLILYNFDHIITFDIAGRAIRDENLNVYEGEALYRDNVLYIPAETVCDIFGFEFSQLYASVDIVRITNSDNVLANEIFKALVMEKLKEDSKVEPEKPQEPDIPTEEEDIEIIGNSNIYPVFLGGFSEKTKSIMDRLGKYKTTFFIDDTILVSSEILRSIYINNHSIGIYIPKEKQNSNVLEYVNSVNDIIFETINEKARLVILEDGNEKYNQILQESGYKIFDVDINSYSQSKIKGTENSIVNLSSTNAINDFASFCEENKFSIKKLTEFN